MRKLLSSLMLLAILAVLALQTPVANGDELPLDEVTNGRTSRSDPAVYTFEASGAGALTLVVRSEEPSADLTVSVTDGIGQPLSDGVIDRNYQQNFGAEQGVVPIPRAGEYQVKVETYGGRMPFIIAATWLPFGALEQPEDPDGSPLTAIELELDEWYEEDINGNEGDMVDWFKLEAESDGEFLVRTQGNSGDFIIECFRDGQFTEWFQRSDNDLDNNTARESILVELTEGEVVYFKVTTYGGNHDYEIRATLAE